jgi:hypothetical protein
MDDDFNDQMIRRGVTDAATIEALAATADAVAADAERAHVARLVELAHGADLERSLDEWFWRPFREVYAAYPSDPAEIHGDVADSCLRRRIREHDDVLAAVLSRLADLNGLTPATALLQPVVAETLEPSVPSLPRLTPMVTSTLEATVLKGFPEDGTGPVPADAVRAAITALISQVKKVAVHADAQATAAMRWANRLNADRQREVRCIEWMLAGQRSDGTPWTELDAAEVATGMSAELAAIVAGVPARRHELLLARLVGLSRVGTESLELTSSSDVAAPESWLQPFVPLTCRLAGIATSVTPAPPREIAHRLLWEHTALRMAAEA